jgi:hypothetical protein
MQPLRLAADPEAGLVHVLDGRGGDAVAHDGDELLQAGCAAAADPGDGRSNDPDAEQIGHGLGQAVFGQQLIMQQIDHERRDARAILHRGVDAVGKRRTSAGATGGAPAVMGAMLGDDKRRRRRQIEYLAGTVADGHLQRHGRSTGRA